MIRCLRFGALGPICLAFAASCDPGHAGAVKPPLPDASPPVDASTPVGDQPFARFPATNGSAPTVYAKTAPPVVASGKPWAFTGGDPVTLTVDAAKALRPVNPYVFGVNAVLWSGKAWFLDPDRIEKAKQAGLRFWRLPGGSASDTYHWDGDTHGRTADNQGRDPKIMNDPSLVQTDDFIDFLRKVDGEAIVTVNYGCARYDSVEQAADMAARWVEYFNKTKKFKVRYWELGNEPYGDWEDGNKVAGKPAMTGAIYGQDYQVMAAAMRQVDPDIFIGAPAVRFDTGDTYNGYGWWMRDMLPLIDGKVDFLFQHYYFGGWPYDAANTYIPPTNATFWDDLHQVADTQANTQAMVTKYTQRGSMPVAFTEFNLVESPLASIELFNALYTAEVLGEHLKQGISAANIWDWQNGLTTKNGGDHGLLATGDPSVPDATPRPTYYTYALFHRAFGDTLLEASSSAEPRVKVIASRFAGGEIGLVVVNRGDTPASLRLELDGFTPKGPVNGWVLTGESLDARQITWNEAAGPPGGGGPFPLDAIAPYVGSIAPPAAPVVAVPAHSLTGMVVY